MTSFVKTMVLEDGYIPLCYKLRYSMYMYIYIFSPLFFIFSFIIPAIDTSSLSSYHSHHLPPTFLMPHELEHHPAEGEKFPFCFSFFSSSNFLFAWDRWDGIGWTDKSCIPVFGFFLSSLKW